MSFAGVSKTSASVGFGVGVPTVGQEGAGVVGGDGNDCATAGTKNTDFERSRQIGQSRLFLFKIKSTCTSRSRSAEQESRNRIEIRAVLHKIF